MKIKIRLLAIILLLIMAMVPILITPATSNAAAKITLKNGNAAPSTLYANHTYNLKVAGGGVKFYSSNKSVATILTAGKLKAKAPGAVKITAKSNKTGKAVATKNFKINMRSTSVKPSASSINLAINETYTLSSQLTPEKSTDCIRYYSSDKTIATIGASSGKITGKKDGKTTITIYAKATKATANSNKNNKTATVDVYVGTSILSAAQTSSNQVSVTLSDSSALSSVAASDFTITNDTTKQRLAISSAAVDSSTKKVTVTTYLDFETGKSYTLSYKESSLSIQLRTATSTSTTSAPVLITNSGSTNISDSISLSQEYAVKVSKCVCKIGKSGDNVNLSTLKENTSIIAGETDNRVYFKLLTENFNEVSDYSNYTLAINSDYAELDSLKINSTTKSVGITGKKEGTTELLIYNSNTKSLEYKIPITVKEARKPTSFSFSNSIITLSNSEMLDDFDKANCSIIDQYGDKVKMTDLSVECIDVPKDSGLTNDEANCLINLAEEADTNTDTKLFDIKDFTVYSRSFPAGIYRYTFTATTQNNEKKSGNLTLVLQKPNPDADSSYLLYFNSATNNYTFDTAVLSESDVDKRLNLSLIESKGSIPFNNLNAMFELFDSNENNAAIKLGGEESVQACMDGCIFLNVMNDGIVYKLASGTYILKATFYINDEEKIITTTIKIKDSQSEVKVENLTTDNTIIETTSVESDELLIKQLSNLYKFTYNNTKADGTVDSGTQPAINSSDILSALTLQIPSDASATAPITKYYLSEVLISVPIAEGIKIVSTVAINELIFCSYIH